MTRVCFFRAPSARSPQNVIGGIERLVAIHSAELRKAGWSASVAVLASKPVAKRVSDFLGGGAFVPQGGLVRTVSWLRDLFADLQTDVLVAEGKVEALYAAAALRGRSSVLLLRRHHTRNLSRGWRGIRARTGDALCDRLVGGHLTISRQLARILNAAGLEPSRVRHVPNGVPEGEETHAFTDGREPIRSSLALVGRIDGRKGHDTLLHACRDLPDVKVHFVGTGAFLNPCVHLAKRLGMSSRVTFHGELPNPWAVLADTELVVLPSLAEGVPLSVLEAFARRKLVVASDTGAVPELVEDGCTGLLVPPGNPDALHETLSRVLACPSSSVASLRRNAHARWRSAHTPAKSAEALRSAIESFVQ